MSLNITFPAVILPPAGNSRISDMSVVVFPEPDSPTSPIVCPGITSNETSSNARAILPSGVVNSVVSPRTLSSGFPLFIL